MGSGLRHASTIAGASQNSEGRVGFIYRQRLERYADWGWSRKHIVGRFLEDDRERWQLVFANDVPDSKDDSTVISPDINVGTEFAKNVVREITTADLFWAYRVGGGNLYDVAARWGGYSRGIDRRGVARRHVR